MEKKNAIINTTKIQSSLLKRMNDLIEEVKSKSGIELRQSDIIRQALDHFLTSTKAGQTRLGILISDKGINLVSENLKGGKEK